MLVDVDGCLTDGEGQPLDWEVLSKLADINRRSRDEPAVPAVTLCTGRPAPYVEVLQQAIGGYQPAIWENGCGLFVAEPYGFRDNPRLTPAVQQTFRRGIERVRQQLVEPGLAVVQPGKEHSASLYPVRLSLAELFEQTRTLLDDSFNVEQSVSCLNVMPAGIDKGAGVDWLAAETGIPPGDMAGVGDSDSDVVFLRKVAYPAAPANATAGVRELARYVSSDRSSRSVLNIVGQICRLNREAG